MSPPELAQPAIWGRPQARKRPSAASTCEWGHHLPPPTACLYTLIVQRTPAQEFQHGNNQPGMGADGC
jgi:hypothetical protein